MRRRPGDAVRLYGLEEMARSARVATLATGDVQCRTPERRILQDVVTCIREGCTIDDAGFRRDHFSDRHLRFPAEMARLFAHHSGTVASTLEVVQRCRFDLGELRCQYPDKTELPGDGAAGPQTPDSDGGAGPLPRLSTLLFEA